METDTDDTMTRRIHRMDEGTMTGAWLHRWGGPHTELDATCRQISSHVDSDACP